MTQPKTKPIIELSYSSNNELHSCPRKYQIRKRFQHPDFSWDTGLPAVGGTAMHEYLQAKAVGDSDVDAMLAFYYAFDFEVEANDSDWNREHRSFEACLITVMDAAEKLAFNPDEVARIKMADGSLRNGIEVKFNLVIDEPSLINTYHFRGAIDLVKYQSFGNIFNACDFKTHKQYRYNGDDSLEFKYKYDEQLIPYGIVIAHLQDNIASLAHVPKFKNTYYSIFIDKVQPSIKEYEFNRDSEDVKAWLNNMMMRIINIEAYSTREVWPRTSTGCEFYAKPCKYYRYCHIEDQEILQDSLLGRHEPAPSHDFGEWITINLGLNL